MGVPTNVAPVIIKRKKVIKGDGHHGGAWKVAYADFVTAMMAFFMLMWLLNATTEKQRKGIADYFSPTVQINRVSGGGDGMFGGDNVFAQKTLARNGIGGLPVDGNQNGHPGSKRQSDPLSDVDKKSFGKVKDMLIGGGGESISMNNALKHVTSRLTDEGLVIEIFALEGHPLFLAGTEKPTRLLVDMLRHVAQASLIVQNGIAVEGHVSSEPVVRAQKSAWPLSAKRADRARMLLQTYGVAPDRLLRVTGHADRELKDPDPLGVRNNRLQVILLRSQ